MDRICITMPNTLREFLIAMSVVQEYQVQVITGAKKGAREDCTITFRLDEKFKYFESCLQVIREYTPKYDYTGWLEQARGEYTCFVDFDFETAKVLALRNKRHITEGLGILIGTWLNALAYGMVPMKYPILKPLTIHLIANKTYEASVLVIKWDTEHSDRFSGWLKNNYPQLDIREFSPEMIPEDCETLVKFIHNFDFVIGPSSAATYLASAMDKYVIELFPNQDEYVLYGNDAVDRYNAIIGNPEAAYIWASWEAVWESSLVNTSGTNHQGETLTECEVSIAEDAAVRSQDILHPK